MVPDVNCPWTVSEGDRQGARLPSVRPQWPGWRGRSGRRRITAGLARVRSEGVRIAAGEKFRPGLHGFQHTLCTAGAQDIAQPSVIKIGGPSACMFEIAIALARGARRAD